MSVHGQWLGQWDGQWFGSIGEGGPLYASATIVGRAYLSAPPIVVQAGAVEFVAVAVLSGDATVIPSAGPTVHQGEAAIVGAALLAVSPTVTLQAAVEFFGGASLAATLKPEVETAYRSGEWGRGRASRAEDWWLGGAVAERPELGGSDVIDIVAPAIAKTAIAVEPEAAGVAAALLARRAAEESMLLLLALADED